MSPFWRKLQRILRNNGNNTIVICGHCHSLQTENSPVENQETEFLYTCNMSTASCSTLTPLVPRGFVDCYAVTSGEHSSGFPADVDYEDIHLNSPDAVHVNGL